MRNCAIFVLSLAVFGVISGNQIPGGPRPITDEAELNELKGTVSSHLKKSTDAQDNIAQLELIRFVVATVKVVSGRLYEFTVEMNENNNLVNCTVSLWDKPWIPEFVKFDVECGEEKRKYGYSSALDRAKRQIAFGGFSESKYEDLQKLHPKLLSTFDYLKSNEDDFVYTLKRIVAGKDQVVAGTHYIVQLEVNNKDAEIKTCEADIYENLKGEFHQVVIKCENKSFRYMKQ